METNQLMHKEQEIRNTLNLYIFKLQHAGRLMEEAARTGIPCDIGVYREVKAISVDFLMFLDFIDELGTSTANTRCLIQNWLETCDKRGIK